MTTPLHAAPWCNDFRTAIRDACQAAQKASIADPGSKVLGFLTIRTVLLHALNIADTNLAECHYDKTLPCLNSCPGAPTPRPVVPVAHKSVATDPPLPAVESMDLDTPAPCPSAATSVPRTYASVAVGTPTTPAPKTPISVPKPSLKPRTPAKAPAPATPALKPIWLIVRPPADSPRLGLPFAQVLVRGPSEPFRLLSHAMSLSPQTKDVTLLGVHQNRSKNLVVSLPAQTPDATVDAVVQVVRKTLLSFGSTPVVDRDTPWSKLLVSRVPARLEPDSPTFTEAEVLASFLHLNPSVSALKITRSPRWIRNPASITGVHSSFTFSFEDPDGSLARGLAKLSLFVFGAPVHLKRWTDKPRQQRKMPQATRPSAA